MDDLQECAEKAFAHYGFSPTKVFAERIETDVGGDILQLTVTNGKWHNRIRVNWPRRRAQRVEALSQMAEMSLRTFLTRDVDKRVRALTETAVLG